MITLVASVTVWVEFDEEDNEVRRVVVDDEGLEFAGVGVREGRLLSKKQVRAAIAAAEACDWPGWEFGW
jgi:hypothetical protein